ncbi:heterokaryon incompatibility protein-domain-containing protein [Xylariaceae sp. FL1651]|nr:heterokaryon incompatibility protein-domain-containing protein [Xylariaceae sp. FL1651]
MSSTYSPLLQERREIRLLRLQPSASFDDPIQCSLFHAFLGAAPEYEALSYVWGHLEFTQEISLDGRPFKITKNLECALRHLRQVSAERVLWVDALCINQADVAERSHQVTLMKDIYSLCERDLAWLGPNPGSIRVPRPEPGAGSDEEAKALEEARAEAEKELKRVQEGMSLFRKMHERDAETLDTMLDRFRARARARRDKDNSPNWLLSRESEMALRYLFRNAEIWSRVWVMQEVSCARRVLLVAANETLDWDTVASFLGDENKPYADAFHITGGHGSVNGIVVSIFGLAQTIQQQRRIVKDVEEGSYESTLIDVLARFKYADARDPRDLIYGLLGLVSERHPIRVDYSKPAEELFADVTKFFIDKAANLDIICQNPWLTGESKSKNRSRDYKKTEPLPSWVADFTDEGRFDQFEEGLESMLFAQRNIFAAGPPNCLVPCKVSQGKRLHVQGVVIDEVGPILQEGEHAVREGETQTISQVYTLPKQWMQLYFGEKLLDDDESAVYPATGEALFRAYWRTLVIDCKSYPIERLSQEDIEIDDKIFKKLTRHDFDKNGVEPVFSLVSNLVSRTMWWRNFRQRFFAQSKTGLLLMLRKGIKEGDILAILDGGKVPCVLRPVQDDDKGLEYRFLNAAYVHGYMDGRAITEVRHGRLKKQEFILV